MVASSPARDHGQLGIGRGELERPAADRAGLGASDLAQRAAADIGARTELDDALSADSGGQEHRDAVHLRHAEADGEVRNGLHRPGLGRDREIELVAERDDGGIGGGARGDGRAECVVALVDRDHTGRG